MYSMPIHQTLSFACTSTGLFKIHQPNYYYGNLIAKPLILPNLSSVYTVCKKTINDMYKHNLLGSTITRTVPTSPSEETTLKYARLKNPASYILEYIQTV